MLAVARVVTLVTSAGYLRALANRKYEVIKSIGYGEEGNPLEK